MKSKAFSWQLVVAIAVFVAVGGQALAGRLNGAAPMASAVNEVAAADTVTVNAAADAFVFSGYGSSNYNGDYLEVGTGYLPGDEQPGEMRALVKFTLPDLPSGAVIDSAKIRMFQSGGSLAATIEMARNIATWTETGVTWNTKPGTADPKWISGTGTYPGYVEWVATDLVQGWYQEKAPYINYGVTFRSTNGELREFQSRNLSQKPQLVIVYHVPTATSTITVTPSNTPTRTPSASATRTPTASATRTPTASATRTPSPTRTLTRTPTFTPTLTRTQTPNVTPTYTLTRTPSIAPTHTLTRTPLPSWTATPTVVGCPDLPLTCERWGSDASEVWIPTSQLLDLVSRAHDPCCDIVEIRWYLDHTMEIFLDQWSVVHQCDAGSQLLYTFDAPGDRTIEAVSRDVVGHTCTVEWLVHVTSPTATPTPTPTPSVPTATHTPWGKPPPATATPVPFNLFPIALEVTQAIQTLDPAQPQVPLVKDKSTLVRFYVGVSPYKAVYPGAKLNAYRGGQHLWPFDLRPANFGGYIRVPSGLSRANINDSFYFHLPKEWCTGTIELRAEVNPDHSRPETDYSDNTISRTVSFNPRAPLALKMVAVRTSPQTASISDPGFWDIISWVESAYPIPSAAVYDSGVTLQETETCWFRHVPYPCGGLYEMPRDSASVLTALWTNNFFTDDKNNGGDGVIYVGMVHPSAITSGAAGTSFMFGHELWFTMGTGSATAAWYAPWGGATLAHELGHSFGRFHVDCGGPEGLTDWFYPYSVCDIGPDVENAYYGYKADSLAIIAPTSAGDLMSYAHTVGKPRWLSDYTYRALYTALSAAAYASAVRPDALAQAEEILVATGMVTPTQGTADFLSVDRLPQGTVAEADLAWAAELQIEGAATDVYALRLLSGTAATLAEQAFTPQEVSDYNGPDQPFMAVMPFDSNTARVAIFRNGIKIAERAVSQSPPTVEVLRPLEGETIYGDLTIEWQASDPEGDALTYVVQYSPDLGATWKALATDHFTPTLTVSGDALAGSTQAMIRVIANDGVNTGIAESAAFTVLPHAPRAVIVQPKPMTVINPNSEVLLSGRAWDTEDGMLPDTSLTWTSDKDGALGTGDDLPVWDLSAGLHRITLRATDSDGMVAAAMVQVYVRASAPKIYLPMERIE